MTHQIVEIYELASQTPPASPVTIYRMVDGLVVAPSSSPAIQNMNLEDFVSGEAPIQSWINMIQLRTNPPEAHLPVDSKIEISRSLDGQICKLEIDINNYKQELIFDKTSETLSASVHPAFTVPWSVFVQIHDSIVQFQRIIKTINGD